MEFTTGGRLEVRITPDDVGKRVSVRQLTDEAPPGEKYTDTVGVLTSWDSGVLSVTQRSGVSVRIPESALVAGKTVPAAPARRRGPSATFAELARATARAWQPVESERLGEWELRAASGFTRRANSVLPLGDPGRPLDDALEYAREWYAARGLPAYVQLATGNEGTQELLAAGLEQRGWTREVSALVRIGALAPIGDLDTDVSRVSLSRTCDESWLRRYHRFDDRDTPGGDVLKVLGSGPSTWFASVAGPGPAPAAIGRCVVDGRWAGFMAIEVAPAARRRGLASTVMAALARKALDEGASAAWLQVEEENAGARALYDGMGFRTHHSYHHYRQTSAAA
ncbi:GNAT family N-acetyltransferase [Streptomyces sp. NBC_01387]|uniref:GNAT family N-acetyltransferase n=1 Tax=unclassified Streptomyces TaxID=2593676 RepID=UPI0020245907|nr:MULTISPECIES: GNAT family N-acetyltransferase [unclassified Streptomyces]WSC20050.1 GNAT family N-acetyltransferase [Streptomyces sp. NBC_01766]WSV54071.1 GNAT family N-acetyltransferase [Streptomyces sp. NBC_01014]